MTNRMEAKFFRQEDRVCIFFDKPLQLVDMDWETAQKWVSALAKLANDAQRVGTGHARMTRKEIDLFEEGILGNPTVKPS